MGNTCTSVDGGVGRDGHIPYYDIRTRGCPSDPSEYFTSTVSADVKRRYVLDHIRYTVAQRRKDQAFSRPSEPPALGPENIHISHLTDSTNVPTEANECSADVSKEESEWGLIREAMKLLSAEAEAKGLADPFQPHLLDKKRVVPELEEVTHERIVAALVRAKESIEAAFLLPMEAMLVEPEVKHSYQGGANASPSGGILKKVHQAEEEDSASPPELRDPLSDRNKSSDKPATINLKDEANAEGEIGSPAENPSPPPPPPPYSVRVSHTCIPWQVTRLSWLATLELITMDTGGQLLPGQAKHPVNRNRRPSNEQLNDRNVTADEQQEFSMLRGVGETTDEPSPHRGGPPAGSRRPMAADLIQTPSSTVEVAHVSFPIDNSVERMMKWSEERAKMAMRYAAAAETRHQTKAKGSNLKGKKAAVAGTEVSEQQDTQLSHYRASLLARTLLGEERLRKLYAMIATRPLVPHDHPLFGGAWANPSHPRVRALLAARWPALSCACESRTQGQVSHSLRAHKEVKGGAYEEEEDSRSIAAAVSELIEMQTEHSRTMGVVPHGDPTNAARSDPLSSADNFNAALLHQLRRNVDGLGAMASNSASISERRRVEAGAGNTDDSSTKRRTNEVPTNRNAQRHNAKSSNDDRQTFPHSPYCLCQACLDDLWADVDLRHLVSWPPTACVARPTIAVLSHTSAVEAVMIVPSPSTSAGPSARRRRGAAARLAESNDYSDGEGMDGLEEGHSSSEGMRDFIFKPLSTAEAASEAGASPDKLQLVRHHKATVAVLFYHHRLKSSNALQRKLLSEDTVSVPLLQPEASASSSMLLGKSRDRDDSPLMARKARLQMLSNYRDLRTQHFASEAERRRKLSNGISLNSGSSGSGGNTNNNTVLPQLLQSLATSVSSGVWFDRTFTGVTGQRIDLSAAAMAVRRGLATGEEGWKGKGATTLTPIAAVATQHGVVGAGEGGSAILLRSSAQTSEASGGQKAEGSSVVVSAEATVFHANDLPFFPPRASSCSFSSSKADEELFVTEARVPPYQVSPLGGLRTTSDAKDIGPHLRDIASSQKLRLDAVDLVVEALVIELEAFELISPDEATSDMRSGSDLSAEEASLVCRLHPSVSHSHAYSSSEVSLLSTLAPALDLRDMVRREALGRQQDGNAGVVFREPNVMTQAAARGAFNKQTLRAERRREFDVDDFINGKNFKPDSKAQESKEEVKTSLAIKMMASHYQSLLDEERETDRTQNSQQESNALLVGTQWLSRYSQHDMSQYQSFLAQVASQVQSEIWMKDLFPL